MIIGFYRNVSLLGAVMMLVAVFTSAVDNLRFVVTGRCCRFEGGRGVGDGGYHCTRKQHGWYGTNIVEEQWTAALNTELLTLGRRIWKDISCCARWSADMEPDRLWLASNRSRSSSDIRLTQ